MTGSSDAMAGPDGDAAPGELTGLLVAARGGDRGALDRVVSYDEQPPARASRSAIAEMDKVSELTLEISPAMFR